MRRASVALALSIAVACEPEAPPPIGHVVVFLDTDAPLPSSDGAEGVAPLIDTARIEVWKGGMMIAAREVGLTAERLRGGESFVITGDAGAVVHVVMWHATTGRAVPVHDESLEGWFEIPPIPPEGRVEATAMLSLDRVAAVMGSPEAPVAIESGHPPSRVGTWSGASRTMCSGPGRAGEVCVPGGAFWMGHPRLENLGPSSAGRRRLVVLSPFFLGAHEVSVAEYRRDGKVHAGRFTGSYAGTNLKDHCTMTNEPSDHDRLPLNCVRWTYAREYCTSIGADLPTEAQLEFAASGFGTRLHPWGDDPPTCRDAVWGRGGASRVADIAQLPPQCRVRGDGPWARLAYPEHVDREDPGRDVVVLEGGTIRDLAGNLAEWALDVAAREEDACWEARSPNLRVDPVCTAADSSFYPPNARSLRGTAFYLPAIAANAAYRRAEVDEARIDVGFRCSRAAL